MNWNEKKLIEKMVYEKYPVSKGEMKCRTEKKTMDDLRDSYRKKLMTQAKEKREY